MNLKLAGLGLAFVGAAALSACAGESADDLALMQGSWTIESAEFGGTPMDASMLGSFKLVIDGETYSVESPMGPDNGTLVLDQTTDPKRMDVTGATGPNAGRTMPSIYKLDGDALNVCYNVGGADYPTEFTSPAGSQIFCANYVRAAE